MPKLTANGIEVEFDTFGREGDRPLLLVMGLGAQMVLWDEAFCGLLADHGHHVVRFDNRDVGLSTKFGETGVPDIMQMMQRGASGEPVDAPYTLDDMADDAAGVLDALGLESSHVMGASMGGMIVQTLAIRHPGRVRSLTSVMSTTGHSELPPAKPDAMAALMRSPAASREEAIEASIAASHVIGSTGFPRDEDRIRARAERSYDRCYYPEGTARQMAAIIAHGSRREALGGVAVPALVIHGDEDPLVPIEGGRDTAAAIPGAEFIVIEGMGHDLPIGAWDRIAGAVAAHTRASED